MGPQQCRAEQRGVQSLLSVDEFQRQLGRNPHLLYVASMLECLLDGCMLAGSEGEAGGWV